MLVTDAPEVTYNTNLRTTLTFGFFQYVKPGFAGENPLENAAKGYPVP